MNVARGLERLLGLRPWRGRRAQRLDQAKAVAASASAAEYLAACARSRPESVHDLAEAGQRALELLPRDAYRTVLQRMYIERCVKNGALSNCALCAFGGLLGQTSGEVCQALGLGAHEQDSAAFVRYACDRLPSVGGGLAVGSRDQQLRGMDRFIAEQLPERFTVERCALDQLLPLAEGLTRMHAYPEGTQFVACVDHEDGRGHDGSHWLYAERCAEGVRFIDFQANTAGSPPLEGMNMPPARPGLVGPIFTDIGFYAFRRPQPDGG